VSLGSEREVEQEWITSNLKPSRIQIARKYQHFNKPYTFQDRNANEGDLIDIKSYKDNNFDVCRLESEVGVQAVPMTVESKTQTTWNRSVNFAAQYEPLEMTVAEQEEIQNSASLKEFFLNVSPMFEQCLQQNELIDIFKNQYSVLGDDDTTLEQGTQTILQEYQSFTDLLNSKDKCVSCIDWHPVQKGVVAMSCTLAYGFEDRISHSSPSKSRRPVILLWSFNDPFHPQLILEAPADVACFQFNPENPSVVAGGCVNGQIVLWDISDYHQKLASSARKNDKDISSKEEKEAVSVSVVMFSVVSSIEFGHRAPVTDIHWFPKNFELANYSEVLENGENGDKQLASCSLDGTVAFWDMRYKKDWKSLDLTWKPFNRIPITSMDGSSEYSLTKISLLTRFDDEKPKSNEVATGITTDQKSVGDAVKAKTGIKNWSSKFYCCTEEGDIILADWIAGKEKSISADEKGNLFDKL
jgi:dynein intermediate chain 3, axonemal